MARRHYTRAEKARAVGLAVAQGTNTASERLGIPAPTISTWRHAPEFTEMVEVMRTKTRDQVADEMWTAIQLGVREVAKGITGDAPLRDKATALGILYDKHALLTGAATSRSESRDITGTLSDAELVAAIHEAERLAGGDGTAAPAPGAPAGE